MSAEMRALTGDAGRRGGKVVSHPSVPPAAPVAPPPELDEADAPNELTLEERRIWLELAPHAYANGTLVPATEKAFVSFIRWEYLSRAIAVSVLERGTKKHLDAQKEANRGYYDFNLRPTGKPMPTADTVQPAAKKAAYW